MSQKALHPEFRRRWIWLAISPGFWSPIHGRPPRPFRSTSELAGIERPERKPPPAREVPW